MEPSVRNIKKLDVLFNIFKSSAPDLSIDYNSIIPLLSVARRKNNDDQLKKMASQFINIQIFNYNSKLFQRSSYDINNYDFNFMSKVKTNSNNFGIVDPHTHKLTSQSLLLENFLNRNNLTCIANVSLPESKLPKRIRNKLDTSALLAILGLLITKDIDASTIIVHEHILGVKNKLT